jgi:hypothetical protein
MKIAYLSITGICLFALASCNKVHVRQGENIITMEAAASEQRIVKLSELCDSIAYIPLETPDTALIYSRLSYKSKSLNAGNQLFTWDGRATIKVGNSGLGPGEDIWWSDCVSTPDGYYSYGSKIIKYDKLGVYAGLEKNLAEDMEIALAAVGSRPIFYLGDTLLFLNPDLTIFRKIRMTPSWPEPTKFLVKPPTFSKFADNNDSVLFYNYTNDTIYRVLENGVSPRWILDVGESKIPLKYLLGNGSKYRMDTYHELTASGESTYTTETDNKLHINSLYETSNFIFISWERMRDWNDYHRNYAKPYPQIAYYNKKSGATVAVSGRGGFVDDLGVMGAFFPKGTHGENLVCSVWPYELREKVDSLANIGKPVDKRLTLMLDTIPDDANPIIIMAHLKKM